MNTKSELDNGHANVNSAMWAVCVWWQANELDDSTVSVDYVTAFKK